MGWESVFREHYITLQGQGEVALIRCFANQSQNVELCWLNEFLLEMLKQKKRS